MLIACNLLILNEKVKPLVKTVKSLKTRGFLIFGYLKLIIHKVIHRFDINSYEVLDNQAIALIDRRRRSK